MNVGLRFTTFFLSHHWMTHRMDLRPHCEVLLSLGCQKVFLGSWKACPCSWPDCSWWLPVFLWVSRCCSSAWHPQRSWSAWLRLLSRGCSAQSLLKDGFRPACYNIPNHFPKGLESVSRESNVLCTSSHCSALNSVPGMQWQCQTQQVDTISMCTVW